MRIILIVWIFILTACSKQVEIPEHVLPASKLSEILVDIHLLEAKIDALELTGDTSFQVYRHFEPQIFAKHGIDSTSYRQSLDFYMSQPELYEAIYSPVIDSLSVREKNNRIEW